MPRASKNVIFSEKGIKNARLTTFIFYLPRARTKEAAPLPKQLTLSCSTQQLKQRSLPELGKA